MKKKHELSVGDTGTYDNIECYITESDNYDLSITVKGLFGMSFWIEERYPNKLFEFLGIFGKIIHCSKSYMKEIEISYYNFKPQS